MGYSVGFYIEKDKKNEFINKTREYHVLPYLTNDKYDKESFEKYGEIYSGYSQLKDLVSVLQTCFESKTKTGARTGLGTDLDPGKYEILSPDDQGSDTFFVSVDALKRFGILSAALEDNYEIQTAINAAKFYDDELAYSIIDDWVRGVTKKTTTYKTIPFPSSISSGKTRAVLDVNREYFHSETLSESLKKRDNGNKNSNRNEHDNEIRFDAKPTIDFDGVKFDIAHSDFYAKNETETIDTNLRNEALNRIASDFDDAQMPEESFCEVFSMIKDSPRTMLSAFDTFGEIAEVCEEIGIDDILVCGGW